MNNSIIHLMFFGYKSLTETPVVHRQIVEDQTVTVRTNQCYYKKTRGRPYYFVLVTECLVPWSEHLNISFDENNCHDYRR